MIVFVLSGGGSRGALEVGALLALLEEGIKPKMVVGSSAGALNAAFLATDPTIEGARGLADVWRRVKQEDIFPASWRLWLTMSWRFVSRQDGLLPADKLRRFVERQLPPGVRHFSDLTRARLYITAADLNSGVLYLWGEDPQGDIVDAVMASAAHPAFFPPLVLEEHQLVDGAVIANVPISVAVDRGATEIYAINVGYAGQKMPHAEGVIDITNQALTTMMYQQLLRDVEECAGKVVLHHITIDAFQGLPIWDLSKSGEMIEEGYRVTKDFLGKPTWERAARKPEAEAKPPLGARVWRGKSR
jgi:NTE family protein